MTARRGILPYNVEKRNEDVYRVTIAVAGFSRSDIEITSKPNALLITGKKADDGRTFVHQGISARKFERQFQLADYVTVTGAALRDGLLEIDLKRELPEAAKPRKIEIDDRVDEAPKLTNATEESQAA